MDKIIYITFTQVFVAFAFIGLSKRRNKHHKYLRYFLFIGFCHLILKLLITEFVTDSFIAYQYFVPFSFGYLPAFFLFVYEVYYGRFVSEKSQIGHFTPLLIALIFYLGFGIYYLNYGIHYAMRAYASIGYYLLGIQFVIYSTYSAYLSWAGIKKGNRTVFIFKHTFIIALLFGCLGYMILLDMFFPQLVNYSFAATVAYLSLLAIFILILHMQFNRKIEKIVHDVEQKSLEVDTKEKYQSSGLEKGDKIQILAQIKSFFEKEEPYRNTDFNLNKLSQQITVPKHHISQVLNELEEKNFFQFVNTYRVEAVCRELAEDPKQRANILEIAFHSGFKSKSAFNQNFKKIKGLTPTAYLTQQGKTIPS